MTYVPVPTREDDQDFRGPSRVRLTTTIISILAVLLTLACFVLLGLKWPYSAAADSECDAPLKLVPSSYVPTTGFCVLARTFSGHYTMLPTFIDLLMQNESPPKVFLVLTDSTSSREEIARIVTAVNLYQGKKVAVVLNVTTADALLEFPALGNDADFGYAWTDAALRILTAHRTYSKECHFLIITNADNIYTRGAFTRIYSEVQLGYQLVSWSFVSHHKRTAVVADGFSDDGTGHVLSGEFRRGSIDLGTASWNLSLWAAIGYRFSTAKTLFAADWFFFDALVQSQVNRTTISQVLMVHQ